MYEKTIPINLFRAQKEQKGKDVQVDYSGKHKIVSNPPFGTWILVGTKKAVMPKKKVIEPSRVYQVYHSNQ